MNTSHQPNRQALAQVAEPEPQCPLCSGSAAVIRELPATGLRESLARYYDEEVPVAVRVDDYRMWRCAGCTLEFAWPMMAGDATFYDWITRQPSYYPAGRWEWAEVRSRLATEAEPLHVLEVGCGSGDFLASLRSLPGVTAVGLDTTLASVAACRAKDIDARAETLADYGRRGASPKPNAIVAFHCLEHVSAPRALVAEMEQLLAPNGRIFVSTPYSPMSFETVWFDPLNHPPHHMTRWNAAAYAELGKQLGLTPRFTLPPAAALIDRVAETFNLDLNGPRHMQPRRTVLTRMVRRPLALFQEVGRQLMHPRIGGKPAANVILVELARAERNGA